jgi:hypothetical protein
VLPLPWGIRVPGHMPGERFEREAKNAPHLFFSAGCRRRGVDPRTCIERSAFGAATTARTDAAQVFGVVLAAAVAFVVSDEYPIRQAWTFVIPLTRAGGPRTTRGEIDGRTGFHDRGDADPGLGAGVGADLGPEGPARDREPPSRLRT